MAYTAELYPAELRSTSQSIIIGIGKMAIVFIPQYNFLMKEYMGIHILTGCGIMFLVLLPTLYYLPETFGVEVDMEKREEGRNEGNKKDIPNLESWNGSAAIR